MLNNSGGRSCNSICYYPDMWCWLVSTAMWGRGLGVFWGEEGDKLWESGKKGLKHLAKACLLKIDKKIRRCFFIEQYIYWKGSYCHSQWSREQEALCEINEFCHQMHGNIHFGFGPCMCNWCETTNRTQHWQTWFVGSSSITRAGHRITVARSTESI